MLALQPYKQTTHVHLLTCCAPRVGVLGEVGVANNHAFKCNSAHAGVLGEAAADNFNPALLRDEPMDKVQQVLREARRVHGL